MHSKDHLLWLHVACLSLSVLVSACGLSPSKTAGKILNATVHSDKAEGKGGSSEELSSPAESHSADPSDKDIAIEPPPVGGAYLACKTSLENTNLEAIEVACAFNPMGLPAAQANSLEFAFAQGGSRASATSVVPSLSDPLTIDGEGKWIYSFKFLRRGLKGPYLYVVASDKSKVPPVDHISWADVRGQEVVSLIGDLTGSLGTTQQMPVGPSDAACPPVAEDKRRQLGTAYLWTVEVLSETANVNLHLKEVCGVSARNPGLNSFAIEQTEDRGFLGIRTNVLGTISMLPTEENPSIKELTLNKGIYQFRMRATTSVDEGLYDNVHIGGIFIEVSGGQMTILSEDRTAFSATNMPQR